jgi:hypothetical protein
MLRRVALVRTDVSEELNATFIRVTRIDELGATLAATSNRRTLRRNTQKTPLFRLNRTQHSFMTPPQYAVSSLVFCSEILILNLGSGAPDPYCSFHGFT